MYDSDMRAVIINPLDVLDVSVDDAYMKQGTGNISKCKFNSIVFVCFEITATANWMLI